MIKILKKKKKRLLLAVQIADNQLLKGGRNRSDHCKANDQMNVNTGRT